MLTSDLLGLAWYSVIPSAKSEESAPGAEQEGGFLGPAALGMTNERPAAGRSAANMRKPCVCYNGSASAGRLLTVDRYSSGDSSNAP